MRVSFESMCTSTSLWAGSGGKNRICQHPGPKGVGVVVSLMQSASGTSPGF